MRLSGAGIDLMWNIGHLTGLARESSRRIRAGIAVGSSKGASAIVPVDWVPLRRLNGRSVSLMDDLYARPPEYLP